VLARPGGSAEGASGGRGRGRGRWSGRAALARRSLQQRRGGRIASGAEEESERERGRTGQSISYLGAKICGAKLSAKICGAKHPATSVP
jgi:hypothetical protein